MFSTSEYDMLPFWIDYSLTGAMQFLTVFVAMAGWLAMAFTCRHSGL
jgi:hypothetical protein